MKIVMRLSIAVREADEKGVFAGKSKDSTPFLLAKIVELTGGRKSFLKTNIQLVYNNVKTWRANRKEYRQR